MHVTSDQREGRGAAEQATSRDDVHVDLPQDLTAPGAARSVARAALGRWALARLVEPVALVVSELVTNAVRYGRPPVWMRLRRLEHSVQITVHDEDPRPLDPGEAAADAESGRGLAIVRALATETGCTTVDGDGKIVWAQVDVTPAEQPPG